MTKETEINKKSRGINGKSFEFFNYKAGHFSFCRASKSP